MEGERYITKTRNKFGKVVGVKGFITMFEKDKIRVVGKQIKNSSGIWEYWKFTGDRNEPLVLSSQEKLGRPRQNCDILVLQKEDIREFKKYIAIASGTMTHSKPTDWDVRPPNDLGLKLDLVVIKKITPSEKPKAETSAIRCSTAPVNKPIAIPVKPEPKTVSKPTVKKPAAKKKTKYIKKVVQLGDKDIETTIAEATNSVCYEALNYLSRLARYKTVTGVDSLNIAATVLINSEFLKLPKDGLPIFTPAGEVLIETLKDVMQILDHEDCHLRAKKLSKFLRKAKFLKK
jgi:hypothetical protein